MVDEERAKSHHYSLVRQIMIYLHIFSVVNIIKEPKSFTEVLTCGGAVFVMANLNLKRVKTTVPSQEDQLEGMQTTMKNMHQNMNSFIEKTREFNKSIIKHLFESPPSEDQRPSRRNISVLEVPVHNKAL